MNNLYNPPNVAPVMDIDHGYFSDYDSDYGYYSEADD